jgi:hypothetical protein
MFNQEQIMNSILLQPHVDRVLASPSTASTQKLWSDWHPPDKCAVAMQEIQRTDRYNLQRSTSGAPFVNGFCAQFSRETPFTPQAQTVSHSLAVDHDNIDGFILQNARKNLPK